ncbi:MAG: septum formation protein Maf [Verrucomicrobiota bacterium]|jgi:septum formation protein
MKTAWILASSSPRRWDLMTAQGWSVEVVPSSAEEWHNQGVDFRELCRHNAALKAQEVARRFPGRVVIGADTLVCLDGKPLGKPRDRAEAESMLRALSGRVNAVCTGVCVVDETGQSHVFDEVTEVHFRDLSDQVIQDYLRAVNTLDKAGGYAVQEHGDWIIRELRGDVDNVIGLPVTRLRAVLRDLALCQEK